MLAILRLTVAFFPLLTTKFVSFYANGWPQPSNNIINMDFGRYPLWRKTVATMI